MGNNMLLSSKVIAFEKAAAKKMGNRGQTGVTSLVGTAGRGPIGVGFACYSFSEVLAKYGGFGADYSLILAARQFYLEAQEGTKIYCMRTVHYDDLLAGTHSAAKGTLTLKTAAVAASAAVIDGLWQAPWFVQNGETLVASVDADPDNTLTFAGTSAAVVAAPGVSPYPWTPAVDTTLLVVVGADLTKIQTLTIPGNGATTYTTAVDVADAIQTQIQDAYAFEGAGGIDDLTLETGQQGSGARVRVTGGTAATTLGLTGADASGSGNVLDLSAVTFVEFKALAEATFEEAVPVGVTVTQNTNLTARISTIDTGVAASFKFNPTSTALARFGFDSIIHSGSDTAQSDTTLLTAKYFGEDSENMNMIVSDASNGSTSYFDLTVYVSGVILETFPNCIVLTGDDDNVVTKLAHETSGSDLVVASDLAAGLGTPLLDRPVNITSANFTGGADAIAAIDDNDFLGSVVSEVGLHALNTVTDFDLLVIPDETSAALEKGLVDYCHDARSWKVFPVLGTPLGLNAAAMSAFMVSAALENYREEGAITWPRIQIANPDKAIYGDTDNILVDPASSVAGIMARVDAHREGGIYDEPAGEELAYFKGATGLEILANRETAESLKETARDIVYPRRVNPIWQKEGGQIFLDGHRNLKGDGNWVTIAQRRGTARMEKIIDAGLDVFRHKRPSDRTRSDARNLVEKYLETQTGLGAFDSDDPEQAFYVDFGTALNTTAVKKAGKLRGRTGFNSASAIDWVIQEYEQMLVG